MTRQEIIKNWELESYQDFRDFANFIIDAWDNHYGKATLTRNILTLATGGWGENEYISSAIGQNKMFQMVCWQMSKRGGLEIYHLPTKKYFK